MYSRIPGRQPKRVIYAGVWQRTETIAEYTVPGNTNSIIKKIMETNPKPNTRFSFNYENQYHVHGQHLDSLSYIVIVESGYSKKLSFEMIEEIKELRYPNAHDVEEIAKKFTANQDENKIVRINNQVSEVNDLIMVNIQKVLKNTTKLQVVAQKTEQMEGRALMFKKGGDELFSLARCQNIKWTIMCGCCGLIMVGGLGYVFYSAIDN